MDPQACLWEILDSLEDARRWIADDPAEREIITEKLRALADWIDRGGFLPNVMTEDRHGQANWYIPGK